MGSFAIGLLLSRPTLGRLADERGRKIVLLIGTIVAAIAPFGYLATQSIGLLILVRIFHGISVAAFTTGYSALIAVWQAHSAVVFLLAAIAEGAGGGTLISMMITMMADRSLPQERGQMFAICIGGLDLGIAIAAPILGIIAELVGYRDMFGYGAAITSVALVIFFTQSSKDLSNSLRFALGLAPDVYALKNLKVRSEDI